VKVDDKKADEKKAGVKERSSAAIAGHRMALAVLLAASLAGCAATVLAPAADQPKIEVPAAAAKRIVLVVKGSDKAAASGDWEPLRAEWRSAMSAAAADAKIAFDWQESEARLPRTAATAVVVKINDYRYLSTGARYGLGAFAGNAYIDSDVVFRDLRTGRVVGTRKYSTSSSAWQGIFSAMTSRQIEAICTEIVKEVAPQ
jgi:hypothetical protein